ncbi:MAG: cadmium transporter ATPase [Actinomycetota bacterium]|nr:MAG: cadmium transporter ATPase [Actinomycetota bacterium]
MADPEAEEPGEGHEEPYEGAWWRFPPMRNALVSGFLLGVTFLLSRIGLIPSWGAIGLYVVAAGFGASHYGPEAAESMLRLRVNIDVLMGVATVGAAVLGLWEEAAFLAFLYGGAEGLEEFTYDRTRGAIRALLDLAPKEAHLLRDDAEVTVPAEELAEGDRFLVRPGESLPTDGVIRAGATSLNEAPISGESVPVEKGEGDAVFAGTVNLTGAIEVEATRAFHDNTLSRIIHLVEEAQEQKTGAQRLIDRFGDRYSPAILLGSLVLLVVPPLLGGDFREWATRAVTLAVAGAPCALVMSTPVAVAAAIGSAGRRGVLIKGGLHLENLGGVRVVAFDKTGTLTRGEPVVTDVVALDTTGRDEVLRLAASVEGYSEHPLARAIVSLAESEAVGRVPAVSFEALTGAGARARVDGQEIYVGSPSLFEDLGSTLGRAAVLAEEYFEEGKTVVLVGTRERVVGLLALRDEARPEAPEAIRALHEEGIPKVAMLTGDNGRTGRAIARGLGIDEVKADLKPGDKSTAVRELEEAFGPAAMVGDGINDAPALATASVGVAMGTAGTDAAIEAADVALMGDDLRAVAYAVRLGRVARRIGRQNIVFSILLLAVLVPSAVLGVINVAAAVTAHEVAEIIAVLNGLRARSR